jgi:hypothetical protein
MSTAGPPRQLLVYRFSPGGHFEGQLVGALERLESGGSLRIRDALFLARDADTDELSAVDVRSGQAGAIVGPLLGFRLDARERRACTERVLAADASGVVTQLGATLPPGGALAAVLVEHRWHEVLDAAAAQTGGTPVLDTFIEADRITDLPQLLAHSHPHTRGAFP